MEAPVQVTPEISFKHFEPTQRIRDRVAREVQHLEQVFPRLISCKVVVEGNAGRHKFGNLSRVRLHIGLPGGHEVAVSQHGDDKHAHEDINVAIRDSFRAAERQLKKVKPNPRVVGAQRATRLTGTIVRFIAEEPAGFIRGEDGQEYYFHTREITGSTLKDLVIGDAVTFRVEDGEKGPMARVIHKRSISTPSRSSND
jgi:cold shock CspA family protein